MSMQRFVSYDLRESDPDFYECYSCGYQYGKRIDETAKPGLNVLPTLSHAIVEKGRKLLAEEAIRTGNVDQRFIPNEIKMERRRRRELG